MPAYGYRLDAPLLAIQKFKDGGSALRVLMAGTDLIALSSSDPTTGMVEISVGEQHLEVFKQDLDERSSRVTLDPRTSVETLGS